MLDYDWRGAAPVGKKGSSVDRRWAPSWDATSGSITGGEAADLG